MSYEDHCLDCGSTKIPCACGSRPKETIEDILFDIFGDPAEISASQFDELVSRINKLMDEVLATKLNNEPNMLSTCRTAQDALRAKMHERKVKLFKGAK